VGLAALLSCVSVSSSVSAGVQPGYAGSSFARFLFLPVFSQPNPSQKTFVDRAAFDGDGVAESFERAVVEAFRGQKSVVGMSPKALRSHFGAMPQLLLEPSRLLLAASENLNRSLRDTRELVSAECGERQTYADFFVHCVSGSAAWRESLVVLSERAFNADAGMFAVVTELGKSANRGVYTISASVAVFLVDLNNGRLVWMREARARLESPSNVQRFPEWTPLFSKIFESGFWVGFPGRETI
jgi:hypothetical protein